MPFAIVNKSTNKVVNLIEAENFSIAETAASVMPFEAIALDGEYAIGSTYDPVTGAVTPPPLPDAPPAPPVKPRKLSKLEFINRFTDAEYVAILSAAKQSVMVEAWLKKFEMTSVEPDGGSIDVRDPRTIEGVNALEAFGIIGQGRTQQILIDP